MKLIKDNEVMCSMRKQLTIDITERSKEFCGTSTIMFGIKITDSSYPEKVLEIDDISEQKKFVCDLAEILQSEDVEMSQILYVVEDYIVQHHSL